MVDDVADLMGLLCYRFRQQYSDVRIALVVYSTHVKEIFNFHQSDWKHSSVAKITASIREAKKHYEGGATATGPALRHCLDNIFRGRRQRGVKRRVLLITDGYSNHGENPVRVACRLHTEKQVDVFPFGVGGRVDLKALRDMTQVSDASTGILPQLLLLPDFTSLRETVSLVRTSVAHQPANQYCNKDVLRR